PGLPGREPELDEIAGQDGEADEPDHDGQVLEEQPPARPVSCRRPAPAALASPLVHPLPLAGEGGSVTPRLAASIAERGGTRCRRWGQALDAGGSARAVR